MYARTADSYEVELLVMCVSDDAPRLRGRGALLEHL